MSRRVGGVFIIEREPPRECSSCGALRECRPYGKGGAQICINCAQKNPEELAEAITQYYRRLDGEPDAKA